MNPITIKVLAGLIQLHGADSTLISDNKGIDELLAPVREQLQLNDFPVTTVDYPKASYSKYYIKDYWKSYEKWSSLSKVQGPGAPSTGAGQVRGGGTRK